MLIDWFTVGAQTINFLILVWLLKRFLYRPVLQAIDARETLIAAQLADADTKRSEAQKERDDFQQRNETFDRQRAALLSQATAEAGDQRHRLIETARQAAEALSARRQEALQRERQSLADELTRRTREEVFAITRKALTDLAGTTLEARITEVLSERLRALDPAARDCFARALSASSAPALVRSAFPLPQAQRTALEQALAETFGAAVRIDFQTAPDLISGIELTASGQKLAWSIDDYLSAMDRSIGQLIKVPAPVGIEAGSDAGIDEVEPAAGPAEPAPQAVPGEKSP